MKQKSSNIAFTLAETLITLTVLGIIAVITVPAIISKHTESANRTKIKKAMTVYDTAINKMVVENGIKSNDAFYSTTQNSGAFAVQNNCTNTSAYFKIAQTLSDDNGTNCRFKASDGLYWDISNITKPIVAVKEEFLNTETADGSTNNAFYLRAWFDANGSLRVDDLTAMENYAQASESDKENLVKLYDFINGKTKSSSNTVVESPYNLLSETETKKIYSYTAPDGNNIEITCYTLSYDNSEKCYSVHNGINDDEKKYYTCDKSGDTPECNLLYVEKSLNNGNLALLCPNENNDNDCVIVQETQMPETINWPNSLPVAQGTIVQDDETININCFDNYSDIPAGSAIRENLNGYGCYGTSVSNPTDIYTCMYDSTAASKISCETNKKDIKLID